jgi:quercetin dioxygenase-like cupin family protein
MAKQGSYETQIMPSVAEGALASRPTRRGLLANTMAMSAAVMSAATMAVTVGHASAQEKAKPDAKAKAVDLQINPANESIRLGPLAVRFLVTGENSSGSVAAFEVLVPGSQRLAAPAHSHDRYDETIYGIDGVLTWTVNGKPFDVSRGQALCIPRGAVHRFDNTTSTDARALCVITPAAIGPAFFRESAEVLNAAQGGPPDIAKMVAVMRRHGITPAKP